VQFWQCCVDLIGDEQVRRQIDPREIPHARRSPVRRSHDTMEQPGEREDLFAGGAHAKGVRRSAHAASVGNELVDNNHPIRTSCIPAGVDHV